MRRLLLLATATSLGACAGGELPPPMPPQGALHAGGAKGAEDPTVHDARLVPENAEETSVLQGVGVEPGGGVRRLVHNLRLVTAPSGAVLSAPDRFPQVPTATIQLPERMGGGFLFQLGTVVWYAERWLAPAKPIFQSTYAIQRIIVGLDRVYVRSAAGAHQAFEPTTGARLDLGPWPASPFVGGYVAADAWRAAAVTDWRGAVATFDAGATWTPLSLPILPQSVSLTRDAILVTGTTATGAQAFYEVRSDGQVGKLAEPPRPRSVASADAPNVEPIARRFGKHPLLAAIEDGWPLADGSAVIARDGALARVRLSDGAVIETAADAYELRSSRCHPYSLARPADPSAFGFVCGEARGKTILYTYDAGQGRMAELRRFDEPRAVLSSGNGALAVRGGCAANAPSEDADRTQQSYCLLPKDGQWREIRVRGDVGGERLVVLADGVVAVVSPPHGDLATARLTLLDKGKAKTMAVTFPPIPQDVARVLKNGVWLDGFEERRPGIVGGWVEAAGTLVGVEISLDGKAKHGRFVRDAGNPMVSGRYGLGFTGARRGYETSDGGMTWKDIDVPEPAIQNPRMIKERACGPIGCTAAGWLRIGWGASAKASARPEPPPVPRSTSTVHPITLDCEPLAGTPPEPPKPPPHAHAEEARPPQARHYPHHYPHQPPPAIHDLPPFYTVAAPLLRPDELGLFLGGGDQVYGGNGATMIVYAWGPKSGDWDRSGRWLTRWLWPYGGWPDIKSTLTTPSPYSSLLAARQGMGMGAGYGYYGGGPQWQLLTGDDSRHLLALARRYTAAGTMETQVFALEGDRPPMEVKKADGDLLPDIIAATRVGGHWYAVTAQAAHEIPASVVWVVDGSFARELARIPRAGADNAAAAPAKLARAADGRALGLVVDGQSLGDRQPSQRWVLPIDIESGVPGEPEAIGAADLSDRTLAACEEAAPGWIYDTVLTNVSIHVGAETRTVNQGTGRIHATRGRACLSMFGGPIDGANGSAQAYYNPTAQQPSSLVPVPWLIRQKGGAPERSSRPTIAAGIMAQNVRYPLRCAPR